MALRLMAEAEPIFIGKLVYNFMLLCLLVAIIAPAFFVVIDVSEKANIGAFVLILSLGVVGLCSATTIVAAIIARASVRGTLFAVLSFPILMPLLLILVSGTASAFEGRPIGELAAELQFLAAYPVVMISGSVMLFRFVWHD
jgi:heme exporter protein B